MTTEAYWRWINCCYLCPVASHGNTAEAQIVIYKSKAIQKVMDRNSKLEYTEKEKRTCAMRTPCIIQDDIQCLFFRGASHVPVSTTSTVNEASQRQRPTRLMLISA